MQDVIIGVDLGGTNIKAGLLTTEGEVLHRCRCTTNASGGPQVVARRIAEAALECRDASPGGPARVLGIGIGSPGAIAVQAGVVFSAPNLPGFDNLPLRDMVQELTGLPCTLENDANAAAVGEQWVGAGRGATSLVMLTLGTGIGGGIVLEGEVWHGFGGVAGEIGHMSIQADGPRCACGNLGCIEAFASATAIVRRMKETIASGRPTHLAERAADLTARDIHEAAVAGDAAALENMKETGRCLGVAITNILHVLNPQVVVLSGGVCAAGDMLMKPIRDEIQRRAIPACGRGVQVRFALLGEDTGIIGAARSFMLLGGARPHRQLGR